MLQNTINARLVFEASLIVGIVVMWFIPDRRIERVLVQHEE